MKCTDLQINDWVYLSEKSRYPMRVTEIDKYNCLLDFEGNEADPFDGIYGENGIAPIELTKNMMLANGWEDITLLSVSGAMTFETKGQSDKHSYRLFVKLGQKHRYVSLFRGYVEHSLEIHARYVHELQRQLRFFGLYDIADNFKIK